MPGVGLLILIYSVSVCLAVFFTTLVVKKREEKQMEEYQDKILRIQREEIQNIYRTMREWRHDYHNHMQKIKAHLAMNQVDELENYLGELENDLDRIDISIKTGNISVDAILSSKLSVVEKKGICVHCKAKVPEKLLVRDIDLCVMLGNLIDNAVEACEKMKAGSGQFIRIYIGIFREQLYISVSNSTKETVRKPIREFISGKLGNHGHGLRRIDSMVAKYGGFVNRKNEPGVFATELLIPLRSDEGETSKL